MGFRVPKESWILLSANCKSGLLKLLLVYIGVFHFSTTIKNRFIAVQNNNYINFDKMQAISEQLV